MKPIRGIMIVLMIIAFVLGVTTTLLTEYIIITHYLDSHPLFRF